MTADNTTLKANNSLQGFPAETTMGEVRRIAKERGLQVVRVVYGGRPQIEVRGVVDHCSQGRYFTRIQCYPLV